MKRDHGFRVVGILVALYGLALGISGAYLAALGGSAYYLLAGTGTAVAGVLVAGRRRVGLVAYLGVVVGSVAWALWESGMQLWPLVARLGFPVWIGVVLLIPWILSSTFRRRAVFGGAVAGAAALVGLLGMLQQSPSSTHGMASLVAGTPTDWKSFANGNDGRRYSELEQITPDNVGHLEVAWIYRTGEDPAQKLNPRNLPVFEATPLKVGSALYFCTPRNQIISVDAERGIEKWRYDPVVDVQGSTYLLACRGVAYHESQAPLSSCQRRIVAGTLDSRLIALDAETGKPCPAFGDQGTVSLKRNLGESQPGHVGTTSAPTIIDDVVVVGTTVLNNISTDMPSGVVRAYDVVTGEQRWSFDMGAEYPTMVGVPDEQHIYERGSPNAWAPFSADADLGLVYVPTGNASTDYHSAIRSDAMNRYASSVVALEVATGAVRWSFQTVHNDLWDYDSPTQPVLFEYSSSQGSLPALLQLTKQGEMFVLDRRNGKPIKAVEERPVPQGAVAGEPLSPTQPFSVETPSLRSTVRTEASMWGITPFDQIWCRAKFRQLRYEGLFTPPSFGGTLQSPAQMGASNWGKASIDIGRNILVANTTNLDSVVQLFPREETPRKFISHAPVFPQHGAPYAASFTLFVSPLGIPCNEPPWGEIRAIDLDSMMVLWKRPFGTARDRLPVPVPVPLGMPNVGGPLTTKSGLTFIGATDDGYLRAYHTRTGKLLWKSLLPAGGQAAPMTYVSEQSGRQFIVIASGGDARLGTRLGDYLVAYALPKQLFKSVGAGTGPRYEHR